MNLKVALVPNQLQKPIQRKAQISRNVYQRTMNFPEPISAPELVKL
jgi:hypothetical protein